MLNKLFQRRCLNPLKTCYSTSANKEPKSNYDVTIVGAGHNGLIAACYLAQQGLSVGVFERRHLVGGAAVTEEIFPGYKFSRASYVLSLLRPQIMKDLKLKENGLHVYMRTTGSFTPMLEEGVNGKPPRSLCLHVDEQRTADEISKFSKRDAKKFLEYEKFISKVAQAVGPLLDNEPPNLQERSIIKLLRACKPFYKTAKNLGGDIPSFYEITTAPITKILDRWFESEPLKATLATDGVIGAMISPRTPGSGYVLLHHMIGEVNGVPGAWGFVRGGMGALSEILAKVARSQGVDIFTDMPVKEITTTSDGNTTTGVHLNNGMHVASKVVASNSTLAHTIGDLLSKDANLPEDYKRAVEAIDYTSPVTKINVAVNKIPNFLAIPNQHENQSMDHHKGTIHLNCERESLIHEGYLDAMNGKPSKTPMIEMCIPSTFDDSLAPPGHHVISLFTQYTPYYIDGGREWTDEDRTNYSESVFNSIEAYAPGFKNSIVGTDVLTPMDLEKLMALTGGNIFHGSVSLDQLFISRPTTRMPGNKAPIKGLYYCGSGTHPGGGVMGSSGRLAALRIIKEIEK